MSSRRRTQSGAENWERGGGGRSSGRAVEGGLTRCVNTLLEKGEKETAERAERGRLDHKGGRERNRHENKQADRLVNTRTVSREVHTDGLRKETLWSRDGHHPT